MKHYLRSLDPDLPRPVWILQAGGLVNAVGNGVVMPFLFIYLHNVRGFSPGLTGAIVASMGAVGLAAGPSDAQSGPRRLHRGPSRRGDCCGTSLIRRVSDDNKDRV